MAVKGFSELYFCICILYNKRISSALPTIAQNFMKIRVVQRYGLYQNVTTLLYNEVYTSVAHC